MQLHRTNLLSFILFIIQKEFFFLVDFYVEVTTDAIKSTAVY